MAAPVIQPSFSSGELAPSLFGRVDLAKFHSGAAMLRNFFVDYKGGVTNRAGTSFVGACIDPFTTSRLIPFQFSTVQNYALIFGNNTMMVAMNGALVINHLTGNVFVLTTPFLASELALLKFTQSADTMTLCHPNHAPQALTRSAHDAWTIAAVNFGSTVAAPTGVTALPTQTGDGTGYVYAVTAIGAGGVTESAPAFATASNSKTLSMNQSTLPVATVVVQWNLVPGAVLYNVYRTPESPGSAPADGTQYGYIGSVLKPTNGAATAAQLRDNSIQPDFSRTPPITVTDPFNGDKPTCTCYYQGRQVYAGMVTKPNGFTMSKSGDFPNFGYSIPARDDDSISAIIASQQVNAIKHVVPMNELLAFSSDGAWRIDGGAQVAAVTPASLEAKPQAFSGCSDVPPIVVNYDLLYVQSKGSIVRDLAYNFYVNVYTGSDLTPISSHLFSGHSILEWAWCEEPHKILWCVREDGVLLSLTYLKEQEIYAWAHHDTNGQVMSVCAVSEGSENVLYMVVRRILPGGPVQYIERMASRVLNAVPEYNIPPDLTRAWFVDCGLRNNVSTFAGVTVRPTALTADPSIFDSTLIAEGSFYSAQTVVSVVDDGGTGSGAIVTPHVDTGFITFYTIVNGGTNYSKPRYIITDQNGTGSGAMAQPQTARVVKITTDDPSHIFHPQPGDIFRCAGGVGVVLTVLQGGGLVDDSFLVDVQVPFESNQPVSAGWSCTTPLTTFAGLSHLNGMTVTGLADGSVIDPVVVQGGSVTLPKAASSVVIGLPYVAQLKSLPLDIPGEQPTVQGRRKTIPAVGILFADSRGAQAGHDFGDMTDFKERDFQPMGVPVEPFTGSLRISIESDWDVAAPICVQQTYPLPCTVLALIPEVMVGDTPG